jgi:molybdopterin-guanine dinucleotide biosynthesis protein A
MPSDIPPAPPTTRAAPPWNAIIVAGGKARRLGGIDKTALVWHGRSLLDGALAATAGARRVCVVGSEADLPSSVLRTVEQPRWGGPAAAIVAGLAALSGRAHPGRLPASVDAAAGPDQAEAAGVDWVVVLAGDLVRAADAVAVLLAELDRQVSRGHLGARPGEPTVDGVISVDADGRRQPLLAVYRHAALAASARAVGSAENLSVSRLIGSLTLAELHLPESLGADVDTPADAARLGIPLPGQTWAPGPPPPPP